jgi:hypothetical protein
MTELAGRGYRHLGHDAQAPKPGHVPGATAPVGFLWRICRQLWDVVVVVVVVVMMMMWWWQRVGRRHHFRCCTTLVRGRRCRTTGVRSAVRAGEGGGVCGWANVCVWVREASV